MNATSDVCYENKLLREENARLKAEVSDLKEHLSKFIALSATVTSSTVGSSSSTSSSSTSTSTSKRVKLDNENSTIASSNNTTISNSTNHNNTATTAGAKLTKIPCYNPSKEIDWLIQFDGGARGNPGIGGSGAVLYHTGITIIFF